MCEHEAKDDPAGKDADEQAPKPLPDEFALPCPFGPAFFLQQLHAFVRDRCPKPDEHLPAVAVHLADGEVLDVCHIMGLSPRWVALAVHDIERSSHEPSPMRTELVPYQIVSRITIRSTRKELARLGFEMGKKPPLWTARDKEQLSPEETLRAAARPATPLVPSEDHCAKHGE